MTPGKPFFEEAEDQSVVKATIVSKYFFAWFNVVKNSAKKRTNRVAYVDLFAGPGRYKDGSKSTPLLILEKAIQDKDLKKMLVTIFNDADKEAVSTLEKEIQSLQGIDELQYPPKVFCNEVGDAIVEDFENMKFIPTLLFVDPFGYKGLSLRLTLSFVIGDVTAFSSSITIELIWDWAIHQ